MTTPSKGSEMDNLAGNLPDERISAVRVRSVNGEPLATRAEMAVIITLSSRIMAFLLHLLLILSSTVENGGDDLR